MDQSLGLRVYNELIEKRPFMAMDCLTILYYQRCVELYDHSKKKKAYQEKALIRTTLKEQNTQLLEKKLGK